MPVGFQDSVVASSLSQPAVLAFAPDGRLFIGEKASGKIRVVENGTLLPTPFLDLTQLVPAGTTLDTFSERGLLGITFDPEFATNGFVYVYHTLCKQPSGGSCASGASKNRVIRVHATGNTSDGAAPALLLDDIDSDAGNHNAGWIDFGPIDHALYIATGDGGSDHTKSQNLASLSGKILRLEADGSIPADNPYAGSATARAEIWAAGLRNPWRCRFRNDGRLVCGDVGQDTWEELDVIFETNNYGWPTTEGPFTLADFPAFTPPIYWYPHNGSSAAIMAGDFGAKTNFPGDYADSFFFGDYARGVIRRIVLDASGTAVVSPATDFATGIGGNDVTEIVAGPDGALYYTRISDGDVHRIQLVTGNHSPLAVISPSNATGAAPLMVAFDGTGSSDPDGDPLTFTWNFGDGSATGSGPIPPTHQYALRGLYTATLTVSDGKPAPGPGVATATIAVGHVPTVTITQPLDGSSFDAGMTVPLAGSAVDAEDGAIAANKLTWKIVFHHADHTHPFIDALVSSPNSFVTADSGETSVDVGYQITLSATDSDGMTGSSTVELFPNTVDLHFDTVPPGIGMTLDGQPHGTPLDVASVVGMRRTIGVSSSPGFTFQGWSDDGAATHEITAPAQATSYVATFATPVTETVTPTATATSTATATPTAPPTETATPTPQIPTLGTVTPTAVMATPTQIIGGNATPTTTPASTTTTEISATPEPTFTPEPTPTPTAANPTPPTLTATPLTTPAESTTPVATATPQGLGDAAEARAADTCQRALAKSSLAFTRTTLAALGRCTSAVQRCVQSSPGEVTCIPKARASCLKATGAIATAATKMTSAASRRCTDIAQVIEPLGLGYADLAADCIAHGDPADDVAGLTGCIAKRLRCAAEGLLQLEMPRAWELLSLADVGLSADSCLTSHGGTGGHVASTDAKALVTCTASIGKAGAAFFNARAAALSGCATSLFTCVQRKPSPPDLATCLSKADAACAHATDSSDDAAALQSTIDARCSEAAIAYSTLRTVTAANLDGVTGECAAEGVTSLANLGLFEDCVAHQHECLAAELVRTAVPRAPDLLGMVDRTLAPADCPPFDEAAPQ